MRNRVPEEVVENIRQASDIVEVISDFVQLKKQGRQYIGLCPFHGENTPSFSVSPEKQLYHCFGCGAGGNVFTFLMEHESFSFVDALQYLAKRAKIAIPEMDASAAQTNRDSPQYEMREGHELAANLFHHILTLTEQGAQGRKYAEERQFSKRQLEHFQIGVAPDRWDALTTILQRRGFSLAKMVEAGLLGERDSDQGYYDRFRNRLMFPICDGQGKVIAFSGRALGEEKPKYLNSAETPIFQKSKTLFALHTARKAIRKENEAVLFEGAADVISAWGAGVENSVATLGTALTEEQGRVLRRNAESVILCYDSDRAGVDAAFRSAKILETTGCHVKVAQMPEDLDPDDYIRKYGAQRFKTEVIGASLSLMAFKMRYLRKGKNLQDEGERLRYIEEILTEIASLPRAVERDHYLRQLSEEFSLSLDALKQEQYQIYRAKRKNSPEQYRKAGRSTHKDFEQRKLRPRFQNAERLLIAHMMRDADIAERVQFRIGGKFNIDEYQALAAHLFAFYGEGNSPNSSQFIRRLEDKKLVKVATELAMLAINEQCSEQELDDYMKLIESYPKWVDIQQKELEMKQERDPVIAARLKMEIIQLKQALQFSG